MYGTDESYRGMVESLDRSIAVFMTLGTNIDATAADDVTEVSGEFLPMSNTTQIYDANYVMTKELATFEGDGIPTATTYGILVPPLSSMAYPPEAGVWSKVISDADGYIDFTFSIKLSSVHESGFTIYTDSMTILEGTVTFNDGSSSETRSLECDGDRAQVSETMPYSQLTIHITRIDQPYRHVRIIEVEFGASITLGRDRLGGELTCITELDPLEKSIPLNELSFSVINVTGDYDADNPQTRLVDLTEGNPVELSFTVDVGGTKTTIPCGRYYVASKKDSDTLLRVTAYDARWRLSTIYRPWTLSASESIGIQLERLLTEEDIPHITDDATLSVMASADFTFADDTNILDDLLQIQQAYAVYVLPDRSGSVRITMDYPSDEYGSAPVMGMFTWPGPVEFTRYNYLAIQYGGENSSQYHEVDLRVSSTDPKMQLVITNPMMLDQTMAQTFANRIVGRTYSLAVESVWRGDPASDVGDTITLPGKWTQDAPTEYKIIRNEIQYDGAFRMTTRGTR